MDSSSGTPSTSSPLPLIAARSSYFAEWMIGRGSRRSPSIVREVVVRVMCALVTCIFALVGSAIGAVTGAMIGSATESGLCRGAGIGAISGAIFSIEVAEASLEMWNSNESGLWSTLYMMEIISSLLNGRLVREKVGPAVQSAVQSQMSAVSSPFMEASDFFETGSIRGMAVESVQKLPKIEIAESDNVDSTGEVICCSVCLQDFQVGEIARRLPDCRHIFHLPCIDSWLIRHGSCPLCRRDI